MDSLTDALRLIAARSPVARNEAVKTLTAPASTRQLRYNVIAQNALADHEAEWTTEERTQILALIETADEPRAFMLRIRLTEPERLDLATRAKQAGTSMSDYVRRLVFT